MDLRQVFAANLIRARRGKGLSQEALAHEADVNRTYISKLEKGSTYVALEIIGKLSAVLGVEPADLLRKPVRKSARRKAEYRHIDIKADADSGWTDYILKFRQKASLLDAIDWTNCH